MSKLDHLFLDAKVGKNRLREFFRDSSLGRITSWVILAIQALQLEGCMEFNIDEAKVKNPQEDAGESDVLHTEDFVEKDALDLARDLQMRDLQGADGEEALDAELATKDVNEDVGSALDGEADDGFDIPDDLTLVPDVPKLQRDSTSIDGASGTELGGNDRGVEDSSRDDVNFLDKQPLDQAGADRASRDIQGGRIDLPQDLPNGDIGGDMAGVDLQADRRPPRPDVNPPRDMTLIQGDGDSGETDGATDAPLDFSRDDLEPETGVIDGSVDVVGGDEDSSGDQSLPDSFTDTEQDSQSDVALVQEDFVPADLLYFTDSQIPYDVVVPTTCPGIEEIPGDGLDNNCRGGMDEDLNGCATVCDNPGNPATCRTLTCSPEELGTVRDCFPVGSPYGLCQDGGSMCVDKLGDDGESIIYCFDACKSYENGAFGFPTQIPYPEQDPVTCHDGIDNNCNGMMDCDDRNESCWPYCF